MSEDIKCCAYCKHCKNPSWYELILDGYKHAECFHPNALVEFTAIGRYGNPIKTNLSAGCRWMRSHENECGYEGKLYEPKEML